MRTLQLPLLGAILSVLCVLCVFPSFVFGLSGQKTSDAERHADRGLEFAQAGDLQNAEVELRRAVELSPKDAIHLTNLGLVLGQQQKLGEANTYLERALELDPKNPTLRRHVAANQWQLGRLREAKQNLELILKVRPDDEAAILLLGMVSENLKDYARAAKLLGSVRSLVRQRPESIGALAGSYYHTARDHEARETLETLMGHPAGPPAAFLGAQVAGEAKDYRTAEKLLTSIQSTYPDQQALGYNLALVRYRANRIVESEKTLLNLIGAGYETSDIYNLLGWCYYRQKKFKETVRAFDQAFDLEPIKESNYLDLAKMLLEHRVFSVAQAVANKAVEKLPSSHRAYLMKGTVEAKQGNYADAVKSYTRAAELNPASPEANYNLASVLLLAGRTEEAAATFEKGIKAFPRDALHYQEYGVMLLKLAEAGDTKAESRAISLLESAISLDGSLPEPHYQLGSLFLRKGKTELALKHLRLAARLEPKSSKSRFALARTYRRLGQEAAAAREYEVFSRLKAEEDRPTVPPEPGPN